MKLFYTPGTCAMLPHIILTEAGFQPSLEKVDLATHKTESGADYYGINPKGYVPALQLDDGQILTEAAVIAQYVADQKPEAKLLPAAGTMERYRVIEWLGYISTEIHKVYGPMFNPATPEEQKKAILERITGRYALIEKALTDREYLVGNTFTVADAYLFTMVGWARHVNHDLSKFPALLAHAKRTAERPAVVATLKAEGLLG